MSAITRFASIFLLASAAQLALAAPVEERGSFSGDGTYYNTGLGSCGWWSKDTDYIVAVNAPQMANGANPNNNRNCGKWINVKGPKGSVKVFTVDTCPTCTYGSLDLSPAAFAKIADMSAGRVHITWNWA
ncbi:RlpA-like double-psi beta-barrel-protein domain-containing protein-containing protein [Spinellus fusiger]|nr:RlpA-like double-psi beta-barrel-protein domain-containing protein-containing protein [Spinellus fusiger]